MPIFRIPRRSGVHRVAAIALYRALLTQCRKLPLATAQRDEIQNIVRNRFKQAQYCHSTPQLRVSFQAGYEAIDHLDAAAAGSEESKLYLTDLLERAPAKVKQTPQPKKVIEGQKEESTFSNPNESIFDRPIPLGQLSGKRHVPVLFNANHIPVLRIKKPQPASLSRFIKQRIVQRQARHDRKDRLGEEREMAAREDEWDDLTTECEEKDQTVGEAMSGDNDEPRWTVALRDALDEVHQQLNDEREKNRVMAEKMQAVVDRETELFEKERAEGKEARRRAWLEKQRQGTQPEQLPHSEKGHDENADAS